MAAFPAANTAAPQAERRTELKERQEALRGRLEQLRRDLAKGEESRGEAADQLRGTETAISDANRRLRNLAGQQVTVREDLANLESQAKRLDRQIAARQGELARLLYRRTLPGDSDAMQLLLAGRDPNAVARDYHFLSLLSRAKAEFIADLRGDLAEKQRLAEASRGKAAELAELESKQQTERSALLAQQQERKAVLTRIGEKLKTQRQEIDTLRRDERRLAKLIDDLAKIVPRRSTSKSREKPVTTPRPPADAHYDPAGVDGAFAKLRGRLPMPVRGPLASRFGTPRAEGGAAWKGIFIRAAEGGEVHAVAAGQVVYADWLRGFGNLIIVDHGDGFLSIYGNNQSLLREAGDAVKGGEALATVGNSGGNPESGLYFELRHQGRPFDPARWLSAR